MNDYSQMKLAGVIPYVQVSDAKAAAEFYKLAFGAVEIDRRPVEDGRLIHCHLEINGGAFMLNDPFPEYGRPLKPVEGVTMHIVSQEPKVWWQRALEAGLEITVPLEIAFWGDYYGVLKDRYGISWGFVGPAEAK